MSRAVFIAIGPLLGMWLFFGAASVLLILGGMAQGPWDYFWFFTMLCWFARDVYWSMSAIGTKPLGPGSGAAAIVLFLIYALYCLPLSSIPLLGQRLIPRSFGLELTGAFLCAAGTGLAIWARHILAGNWGPGWAAAISLKDSHQLVQGGPYAMVRHPIYLGLLMAAVGMFLVLPEVRALGLLYGIEVLLKKMVKEEAALREAFPDEYPSYEQRVKKLLPGIW